MKAYFIDKKTSKYPDYLQGSSYVDSSKSFHWLFASVNDYCFNKKKLKNKFTFAKSPTNIICFMVENLLSAKKKPYNITREGPTLIYVQEKHILSQGSVEQIIHKAYCFAVVH